MTDTERQLAEIDLRRSQLEAMLAAMPFDQPCCEHNGERGELEDELKSLWATRMTLIERRS